MTAPPMVMKKDVIVAILPQKNVWPRLDLKGLTMLADVMLLMLKGMHYLGKHCQLKLPK